jgi:hypothetical protein
VIRADHVSMIISKAETCMSLLALLLKISLPPVLVAVMTLAARRWGPTFGGLIMGLPWMTGPVLFFLGLDKGPEFLVAASGGVILAVWGLGAFILGFGYAATWFGWPGALATAIAGYSAAGLITQTIDVPLAVATPIAFAVLLLTYWLLPAPTTVVRHAPPPVWDIAARMIATFALVSVIMVSADRLGPQRSGLVASYPVILTVIGAFTHSQLGQNGLLQVLRGISLSLLAFTGFFATVGMATPIIGQISAYAVAAIVALTISGCLIAWSRRPSVGQPAARRG